MIAFLNKIGGFVTGYALKAEDLSFANIGYYQMVIQILIWLGLLILIALIIAMFIQTRKTNKLLQKMCEAENIELPKPLITKAKIKEVLTKKL